MQAPDPTAARENNSAQPAKPEHPLMTAIGRGLPITLLIDLVDPNGPRSYEMIEREGIDLSAVGRRAAGGARSA